MSTIASEKFKRVCDGVWNDRDTILTARDGLSGEAILMRAVYWRLCKAWGSSTPTTCGTETVQMSLNYQRLVTIMLTEHVGPHFDGKPFLNELIRQYREEAVQTAAHRRKSEGGAG